LRNAKKAVETTATKGQPVSAHAEVKQQMADPTDLVRLPEKLKDIARNAKDYTVEIEFSELCYERPLAWGYFRRDAYIESNWDSHKLWIDHQAEPAQFKSDGRGVEGTC
jgi:hypothetical protein